MSFGFAAKVRLMVELFLGTTDVYGRAGEKIGVISITQQRRQPVELPCAFGLAEPADSCTWPIDGHQTLASQNPRKLFKLLDEWCCLWFGDFYCVDRVV